MTDQPVPLSNFELSLVTFLDQQYQLTGRLLTAEQAHREHGIPVKKFEDALNSEHVRGALVERGIVFERYDDVDEWVRTSLTPVQLLLANSLLDLTDTRSIKKKCQDAGVSTLKYESWLKDPVFKDYLAKRAEQKLGDVSHEADLALLDRVRSGDMKAIEYYNEMTGKFVRQTYKSQANVDVHSLVVSIIEIIDEHVTNADDKLAVGNELRKLIATRNTATALVTPGALDDDDVIVVPEVAQLSELHSQKQAVKKAIEAATSDEVGS